MLKEHGNFQQLEIQIAKKHVKSNKKLLGGGWYTKQYLEQQAYWTKTWP